MYTSLRERAILIDDFFFGFGFFYSQKVSFQTNFLTVKTCNGTFHEAFRVWTDHYKSRMSNVGRGEAEAYIADPRLEMVCPYKESFME